MTTEQSEWGCWGTEMRQICWATKLKLFSHNSAKSTRNKLTRCYSKLYVIESSTFGKIFDRLSFNNEHTSQISKFPINDMLTKFELCEYPGIIDNRLQDYNFSWWCDSGVISNSFWSKCKDDVFGIPPKSATLSKCHVFFRAIYTGIFLLLFHNNKYN